MTLADLVAGIESSMLEISLALLAVAGVLLLVYVLYRSIKIVLAAVRDREEQAEWDRIDREAQASDDADESMYQSLRSS